MSLIVKYLILYFFLVSFSSKQINYAWRIEVDLNDIQREKIDEAYFYGDWFIYAKANKKYRSKSLLKTKKNYYSFKKDNSLTVFLNNVKYKGSWVLTSKNKVILEYNNNKYMYRISYYETDFVVLADLNTYLSLQKKIF
tara:strand:+ start:1680 stop:2096 length:417 start_codon:yes stop_codon:yes gene_type:complete